MPLRRHGDEIAHRRKPLTEQVIVITGASRGIGLATAKMAASRGARVVLALRNGATLAKIEQTGGQAVHVSADVGRRADVQAIVDKSVSVPDRSPSPRYLSR